MHLARPADVRCLVVLVNASGSLADDIVVVAPRQRPWDRVVHSAGSFQHVRQGVGVEGAAGHGERIGDAPTALWERLEHQAACADLHRHAFAAAHERIGVV